MLYIKSFALSLIVFSILFGLSRYIGFNNPYIDWTLLIVSSLIPLFVEKIRKGSLAFLLSLISLNGVVMFFLSFWLLAVFFSEGL